MIVLVGGQCRKAGKTTTVCDLIAATRWAEWVSVKVSPHAHEAGDSADPDTERYLRAGASEARLVQTVPEPMPVGRNVIVESNSAVGVLRPDVVVFVESTLPDAEWKASADAVRERADLVVTGRPTAEQIARFVSLLATGERQSLRRPGWPRC